MSQPQPPPPSLDDAPMITAASWREFFDLTTLSSPASCSEALTRLDQNFHHFRYDYSILAFMIIPLLILFDNLSIVTLLVIAALLILFYLYFSSCRCAASPLRVFSYGIDDRSVFWTLYIATMSAMVIFHNSGRDVLVFIPVYLLMVCLHGALTVPRLGDDLDPYLRLLGADTDSSREPTYNTIV